jgi:hypothetical protein
MTTDPDTGTTPTLAERVRLDVDRRWLFAIAGVIWMGVGILLLTYAVTWLAPVSVPLELELTVAGLAVAAVFLRFVFHGIVTKNIARIEGGPARVSAFSFQGWRSYLITVFMIVLGDPETGPGRHVPGRRARADAGQRVLPPAPVLDVAAREAVAAVQRQPTGARRTRAPGGRPRTLDWVALNCR